MPAREARPAPKPAVRRGGKAHRRGDQSLAAWRKQVLTRDNFRCFACGLVDRSGRKLAAHHLIFRSHCEDRYVDDVNNGITLCNDWGNGCHPATHALRRKIPWRRLPAGVKQCLEDQGLRWDDDGAPYGPCGRYFIREERHG